MTAEKNLKLSDEQIAEAMVLMACLIKTAASPTFRRRLTDLWDGAAGSDNVFAIQNKLCNELSAKLARADRYDDYSRAFFYLNAFADHYGFKRVSLKSRGVTILKEMSVAQYQLISDFIYKVSVQFGAFQWGETKRGQHECHDLAWDVSDYLIAKSSVEVGVEHQGLQSVLDRLLASKPVEFFRRGYLRDLLVIDRVQLAVNIGKVAAIRTNKEYLSTCQIQDKNYVERDAEHYEIFPLKASAATR